MRHTQQASGVASMRSIHVIEGGCQSAKVPKCQSADGQTFKSIPVDNRVKAYHVSAMDARLVDKLKLRIYSGAKLILILAKEIKTSQISF